MSVVQRTFAKMSIRAYSLSIQILLLALLLTLSLLLILLLFYLLPLRCCHRCKVKSKARWSICGQHKIIQVLCGRYMGSDNDKTKQFHSDLLQTTSWSVSCEEYIWLTLSLKQGLIHTLPLGWHKLEACSRSGCWGLIQGLAINISTFVH